ncbi:hypothetical protein Arub01_50480 [Actinomadura rubrobrunea]|uniref:Uncharacterized protein n=1 Tax=Actinomadura rubrobrunea TaxID=115335 RepID=A0A9W6Q1B1_9ACTN|nr:hypothetical protein [Actinomadura rubrobrunea]GLW66804.1 hypothetical protein Arub01_50480 [Actinomadura rubrobrunea]
MQSTQGAERVVAVRGPYRGRPISFLGPHETAGWRLKVYGITTEGARPPAGLVDAALTLAPEVLPAPAVLRDGAEPDRYGLGFVVVHRAGDFCFALYDWWAGENELRQRLYSSPLDAPRALRPHPTPAVFCVWEGAVVDHERRAWLRHVLTRPEAPDVDAYLRDTFEGVV